MAPLSLLPDADLVRSYLRDIGRVPLLSHQQEITLGRQVQEDRKSTRLNSSHSQQSRMPSSA